MGLQLERARKVVVEGSVDIVVEQEFQLELEQLVVDNFVGELQLELGQQRFVLGKKVVERQLVLKLLVDNLAVGRQLVEVLESGIVVVQLELEPELVQSKMAVGRPELELVVVEPGIEEFQLELGPVGSIVVVLLELELERLADRLVVQLALAQVLEPIVDNLAFQRQ